MAGAKGYHHHRVVNTCARRSFLQPCSSLLGSAILQCPWFYHHRYCYHCCHFVFLLHSKVIVIFIMSHIYPDYCFCWLKFISKTSHFFIAVFWFVSYDFTKRFLSWLQRLLPESQPGSNYLVDAECYNGGVPYADDFFTTIRYCITKVADDRCRVRISGQVTYKKHIWGLIKSRSTGFFISCCSSSWTVFHSQLQTELSNVSYHPSSFCGRFYHTLCICELNFPSVIFFKYVLFNRDGSGNISNYVLKPLLFRSVRELLFITIVRFSEESKMLFK